MTETMQALIGGLGPAWERQERPVPTAGAGEAVVRIRAAGLNRADLHRLGGTYNPGAMGTAEFVGGLEGAGEVVAVGNGVSADLVGTQVMSTIGGSFAQYASVDHRNLLEVPEGLSWIEAAALPVALSTEHDALVTQAGFTAGQSVLVLGATSSVGLIGVQLAKALGASIVIATTTNDSKAEVLRQAGADVVVNTRTENLAEVVLATTEGTGVDVVLDHLAGDPLASCIPAVRHNGIIINIGRLAGSTATINVDDLSFRRITLRGTTFSIRTADERAAVNAAVRTQVLGQVAAGNIKPIIDRVFAFDDAAQAADYMRSNQAAGKVVLELG